MWAYYNLATTPASYDIVWCRFPYEDEGDVPKMRPALVRQSFTDQDGNPWVEVVYGTSQDPNAPGHANFAVVNIVEMNLAGLHRATRFCLDRSILLPWSSEYFTPRLGFQTPVIGRLSAHMIKLLQIQASYFAASKRQD